MQQFGQLLLHLTFFATLIASMAGYVGARSRRLELIEASRYALYGICLMTLTMSLVLLHSLVTHDFTNKYVATYTDVDMPLAYVVAAFWGGEKGALLFWTASLSLFGAIAVHRSRHRSPVYLGYSTATLLAALFFFYMLMVLESSPFETFLTYGGPRDGKGMNPLLQNPTMTIHPPSLLTGYIAFTIPFAFGFGALLSGKLDNDWAKDTRTWTIVSWIFLTVGLILGGMWAYEELGWGGYWAWDPVENAGFIPWLTATAFLHSVMIQEKRGMLKRWNFFLVLLTFLLTIFGTFLTRSQLIDSIHAFADSTLATYFLWYMVVIVVASALALSRRWKELSAAARIDAFLSRESMFVLNNIVLLGLAFVVMWGTVFSKVSELEAVQRVYNALVDVYNGAFAGLFGPAEPITQAVVLGEPWFNRIVVPIGLVLLMLTGVGPIIAWGRATRSNFEKNFRLPLSISCITMALGGAIYGFWRVASVRADLLAGARAHWLDATRTWVESALSHGEAPGALPSIPDVEWGAAYSAWAGTLGRLDAYTFLAFLFSLFVTSTIAIEFYAGARARVRKHGGSFGWQLMQLTLKARRRYGGYIVHLGIVLAFVAFAGSAFKAEQPEQVVYPGDRIDLAGYHLTFTDLRPEYVADGAFVASRATMIVMRDGETVPAPVAQSIVDAAKQRGWEPFHVETVRSSPVVRLRMARDDARADARLAVFLQTFFRDRIALDAAPPASRSARFRVRDIDAVQVLPPSIQVLADGIRDHFASVDERIRVSFMPGSPAFSIEFTSVAQRDAFVEAMSSAAVFPELAGGRFNEELGAIEVIPAGVGFALVPEVRFYRKHPEPTTEVAIRSTVLHDLYLAMRPAAGKAFINLSVVVLPLVSFLWLGALVMVIGGVICLLPSGLLSVHAEPVPQGARATRVAGVLVLLAGLGAAAVLLHADPVRAQSATPPAVSGGDEDHGAATPLKNLPPSDITTREQGIQRMFDALHCVDRQGAEWIFREGSLVDCSTSHADELRAQLLALFESHTDVNPAMATHQALQDFLNAEPANERLLRYPSSTHMHLMTTTNCYCGCSDSMSLSQCPLTCSNSKEWNTRFKLLLAQKYEFRPIQEVYLGSKNAMLAEDEQPWTMENVSTDSKKGITWVVPAVVVGGAGAVFAWVMSSVRRRKNSGGTSAAAGGEAARGARYSAEERALLEDELEEWD